MTSHFLTPWTEQLKSFEINLRILHYLTQLTTLDLLHTKLATSIQQTLQHISAVFRQGYQHTQFNCYLFRNQYTLPIFVTIPYPMLDEDALVEMRKTYHKMLSLPTHKPLLRRACEFVQDQVSKHLRDVHTRLNLSSQGSITPPHLCFFFFVVETIWPALQFSILKTPSFCCKNSNQLMEANNIWLMGATNITIIYKTTLMIMVGVVHIDLCKRFVLGSNWMVTQTNVRKESQFVFFLRMVNSFWWIGI